MCFAARHFSFYTLIRCTRTFTKYPCTPTHTVLYYVVTFHIPVFLIPLAKSISPRMRKFGSVFFFQITRFCSTMSRSVYMGDPRSFLRYRVKGCWQETHRTSDTVYRWRSFCTRRFQWRGTDTIEMIGNDDLCTRVRLLWIFLIWVFGRSTVFPALSFSHRKKRGFFVLHDILYEKFHYITEHRSKWNQQVSDSVFDRAQFTYARLQIVYRCFSCWSPFGFVFENPLGSYPKFRMLCIANKRYRRPTFPNDLPPLYLDTAVSWHFTRAKFGRVTFCTGERR